MSEAEDNEIEIVHMTDEDGVEQPFAMLAVLELEEDLYAVLAPLAQLEAEEPELDLYAFQYVEHEEEIELIALEEDELIDAVLDAAERLWFQEAELADDAEE
jgi:uncharacterized protein YrzB (UPF0473 family)